MQGKRTFSLKNGIWLLLLSLLTLVIRIRFAGIYAESWDAVDFALALERFDILEMRPHFPGYPVYILAAHAFLPWVNGDSVLALTWLSAFFGSFSLFPFYFLACRLLPTQRAVWVSMLLFAANPFIALSHVQPMSEAFGLFALLVLTALLSRSVWLNGWPLFFTAFTSASLFALILGIRLSYFPVGCLLFFPIAKLYFQRASLARFFWQILLILLIFFGSLALWLLPVAATEGGLLSFLKLGVAFAVGHFTDWGGTSFADDSSWLERLVTLAGQRLFLNGILGVSTRQQALAEPLSALLTGITAIGFLGFICVAGRKLWKVRKDQPSLYKALIQSRWFILLAVVPYALWVFVGQNSEKARHILPLLPWMILLLAYGWEIVWQKWQSYGGRILVAVTSILMLITLAQRQAVLLSDHLLPPPTLQMIRYVEQHYPAERTYVYTWEEQRLFDFYASVYQTERVRSYSYFTNSVLLHAGSVEYVLLTNAVLDGFGADHPLRREVREIARFTADPLLYPAYHSVILYQMNHPKK